MALRNFWGNKLLLDFSVRYNNRLFFVVIFLDLYFVKSSRFDFIIDLKPFCYSHLIIAPRGSPA